jgi:hypothetical protein
MPILGIIASAISGNLTPPVIQAYESIATSVVGSGGVSSVTFSSIPQTFTHLQIRGIARSTRGNAESDPLAYQFNSDTTNTNYGNHNLAGDGASVTSGYIAPSFWSVYYMPTVLTLSNVFGVFVTDILDYKNTNKYKVTRSLGGADWNNTGTERGTVSLNSTLWQNTNAITSITVSGAFGGLAQYSSIALYGIKG